MKTTKIAVGVMDAVKATMTVQLAENATELVLSLQTKKMTIMNNFPFPPATGAVPWTAKQIKEHAQQQRAQTEDALL